MKHRWWLAEQQEIREVAERSASVHLARERRRKQEDTDAEALRLLSATRGKTPKEMARQSRLMKGRVTLPARNSVVIASAVKVCEACGLPCSKSQLGRYPREQSEFGKLRSQVDTLRTENEQLLKAQAAPGLGEIELGEATVRLREQLRQAQAKIDAMMVPRMVDLSGRPVYQPTNDDAMTPAEIDRLRKQLVDEKVRHVAELAEVKGSLDNQVASLRQRLELPIAESEKAQLKAARRSSSAIAAELVADRCELRVILRDLTFILG
jgi:hypothetical protein